MKKRLIFIVLLFSASFFVSGCKNRSDIQNNITIPFEGQIKVISDGKNYECELHHTPEQINSLEILKPEGLAGLTFTWEGESYKVIWKDLSCELNKSFLPQKAFAEILIEILNKLSEQNSLEQESSNNDGTVFSGTGSFGKFKITVTNDSTVKNISIPDEHLEFQFHKA